MSKKSPRLPIWISPRDDNGKLVDPHLIAMGYEVFHGVMKFATELGLPDITCVPGIVEGVVHAASRKNGSGFPIERSAQYLYAACKYEIYHLAEREELSEQTSIEEFDAEIDARSYDWESAIHRRLRVEGILSELRGKHRDLLILFSQSYTWEHIGELLGMTAKSAKSMCYRLLRRLREGQLMKEKNARSTL